MPTATTVKLDRRQLCARLGAVLLMTASPLLPACKTYQPEPFTTGESVTPPLGCSELRRRDPSADC